jgi:glycosyltransferase involved in cell wall biosynthesis
MSSISVLISVYRKENPKFLNDALNSIWDLQIIKPKEIILIKDGKLTKELHFIVKSWKDKLGEKLILIENFNNIGLTKSLNKGIEFCTGDFIARMDADDISDPNRFFLQLNFFLKNRNVDILGGSILEFDGKGNQFKRSFPSDMQTILKKIPIASPLAHPAVMFRRIVFDDGNRYNEKYITSQDIAFWFHLIKKGYKISNLNEVVLNFRNTNETLKRRSFNKAFKELKIYLKGSYSLFGINIKLAYPFLRFFFRLLPIFLTKIIYKSFFRKVLNS